MEYDNEPLCPDVVRRPAVKRAAKKKVKYALDIGMEPVKEEDAPRVYSMDECFVLYQLQRLIPGVKLECKHDDIHLGSMSVGKHVDFIGTLESMLLEGDVIEVAEFGRVTGFKVSPCVTTMTAHKSQFSHITYESGRGMVGYGNRSDVVDYITPKIDGKLLISCGLQVGREMVVLCIVGMEYYLSNFSHLVQGEVKDGVFYPFYGEEYEAQELILRNRDVQRVYPVVKKELYSYSALRDVQRKVMDRPEEYDGIIVSINAQEYKVKNIPTVELNCIEQGRSLVVTDRHESRVYRCVNTPQLGIGEYAFVGQDRRRVKFVRLREDKNRAQTKDVFESLRSSPTVMSLPDPVYEDSRAVAPYGVLGYDVCNGKYITYPPLIAEALSHSEDPVSKNRIIYSWVKMFMAEPSTVDCKSVEDQLKDSGNSEHYRTAPVPSYPYDEHRVLARVETISALRASSGKGYMMIERYIDLRRKAMHMGFVFPEWYFRNRLLSEAVIDGDNVCFKYGESLDKKDYDMIHTIMSQYVCVRPGGDLTFTQWLTDWKSSVVYAEYLKEKYLGNRDLCDVIRLVEQHPCFEYSSTKGLYRVSPVCTLHCTLLERVTLGRVLREIGINPKVNVRIRIDDEDSEGS